MNYKIIVMLFVFYDLHYAFAQTDTLIRYNIETKQLQTLNLPFINETKIFDNTDWNYGSETGVEILDNNPPIHTFPSAGFTDYYPAQNYFSINKYPVRTAAKIFFITNDSLKHKCSGILVAKNYVLTACHCIGEYDSNKVFQFQDSIIIFPAFDNGIESPLFKKSLAADYVTFKSNMIRPWKKDIALIKLKEDIGLKTGWVGIAFSKDNSFFEENVFHKFSYPAFPDIYDPTRKFNGDTLYYNYGTIDIIGDISFEYYINAIPGQSGSSLIFTDNKEYYSLATLVWSFQSWHIRITPEIFYAFKSVIDNTVSNLEPGKGNIPGYYLSEAYPNPFNPVAKIRYSLTEFSYINCKIYDMLGNEMITLVNQEQDPGEYEVEFNGSDFASGVYFFRIQAGKFIDTKKIILLR